MSTLPSTTNQSLFAECGAEERPPNPADVWQWG